ncbi:DUF4912 domain-containing protein [Prochlorococcus sp. MIT 1300]|uniref:DUF4912 domain-containing protein n=1 Tax=Prochlorococcus sp. MIT 1300 TaxID=3096218 RepID=UPI002A74A35E|nr:DUF4912 domain-containing protein [Prochlorococcus sp. MIT 1300]
MTEELNTLSRLTLRQLRHKASDLGVSLYSRKSKATLIKEIFNLEQKKNAVDHSFNSFWRAPAKKDPELGGYNDPQGGSKVVFLPRDPEWSYVFWEISESDRKRALARGASRLCLRLSDVTGITDGTAHPHALQEVQVDSHNTEWYLPIPMSDREYRVELGYRLANTWISLAFSSVAKVPSLHPSSQILDQFVPFSLESTASPVSAPITPSTPESKDIGLHERLYQSATSHYRKTRVGSEEFQEHEFAEGGLNQSGAGLWASGRNESGIGGVVPRNRSLWLVADSELIVYGATDPAARLTIGGEEVPLSSDGTFRLQVPFRDGQQEYPIEATVTDGSQKRNITMKFQRDTPVDNTNPKEQSQAEWF